MQKKWVKEERKEDIGNDSKERDKEQKKKISES